MTKTGSRTLTAKDRSLAAATFTGVGKEVEYRVDGIPGLVLAVTKPRRDGRSRRIWRVYYSLTHDGGRTIRKARLGQYPAVGLALARRRAAEIMEAVDQGNDPVGQERKRRRKAGQDALTFKNLCDDYIADQKRSGFASATEVERALRKDVLPLLGGMRLSEMTSLDVQHAVDTVAARVQRKRGARCSGEMARHCLRYIKQVYNHALYDNEELRTKYGLKENPAAVVGRNRRGKPGRYGKPTSRERALTDHEIAAFWRAIDASDMDLTTSSLLKLLLLTGVRLSELRKAQISEVVLDGPESVWRVPKERDKNRRAHVVPLTPIMLRILAEVINKRTSGPVFPSTHSKDGFLGKAAARQAITRLFDGDHLNMTRFSPHDLRRTLDTGLARLGIPEDVQKRVLNHAPQSVTAKHYNRHTYEAEKRHALEKWSAHVEALTKVRTGFDQMTSGDELQIPIPDQATALPLSVA